MQLHEHTTNIDNRINKMNERALFAVAAMTAAFCSSYIIGNILCTATKFLCPHFLNVVVAVAATVAVAAQTINRIYSFEFMISGILSWILVGNATKSKCLIGMAALCLSQCVCYCCLYDLLGCKINKTATVVE